MPTPGTASQVKALVASSTSITKLPSHLVPSLPSAPYDTPGHYYPTSANGCSTTSQCVYGDTTSITTVVLYGDSHAQMWLPALAPVATLEKFRLVLVWHSACPYADLTTAWSVCRGFRSTAISEIQKIHPALVLLAEKVSNVVGPGGTTFTNAQWQKGVETTVTALTTTTTRVAVVGDLSQFDSSVPACLDAYATNVQKCAIFNPNPKYTQHFNAEKMAAAATNAAYVNTQPWLCTKRCSPVVGAMIVFSDQGHVAATYAEYLSGVWNTVITNLMAS